MYVNEILSKPSTGKYMVAKMFLHSGMKQADSCFRRDSGEASWRVALGGP